jgi:hypothetical protein
MFPDKFDSYEPFAVRAVMEKTELVKDLLDIDVDKAPIISYKNNVDHLLSKYDYKDNVNYVLASYSDSSETLKPLLEKNRIEISPAAHTYNLEKAAQSGGEKIPPSLLATLDEFDYYNTELGLNIILADGYKLKKLRFLAEIYGDDNKSPDVVAYDTFPDDQVKRITIAGGKITLGVDNLLKLVAGPVGETISNLLKIELNPWTFNWGYDRIEIQNSEGLTYDPEWILKHDNIYKGFNPTMIMKKRKNVRKILAKVQITYTLELPKDSYFQLRAPVQYQSDSKVITIL